MHCSEVRSEVREVREVQRCGKWAPLQRRRPVDSDESLELRLDQRGDLVLQRVGDGRLEAAEHARLPVAALDREPQRPAGDAHGGAAQVARDRHPVAVDELQRRAEANAARGDRGVAAARDAERAPVEGVGAAATVGRVG